MRVLLKDFTDDSLVVMNVAYAGWAKDVFDTEREKALEQISDGDTEGEKSVREQYPVVEGVFMYSSDDQEEGDYVVFLEISKEDWNREAKLLYTNGRADMSDYACIINP